MRKIEVRPIDGAALARDVESAEARVDQREQRRKQYVRRENSFVYLVPERESVLALRARRRHVSQDDVRKRIREHRERIAVDIHAAEKQIHERNREEDQSWQCEQKMRGRIEVAEALRDETARGGTAGSPGAGSAPCRVPIERVGRCAPRGSRSPGPAASGMFTNAVFHAARWSAQGGMRVFGHRLDRDAADLLERLAPQDRARTAKKAGIPEIVAVLHQSMEQLPLVGNLAEVFRGSARIGSGE